MMKVAHVCAVENKLHKFQSDSAHLGHMAPALCHIKAKNLICATKPGNVNVALLFLTFLFTNILLFVVILSWKLLQLSSTS